MANGDPGTGSLKLNRVLDSAAFKLVQTILLLLISAVIIPYGWKHNGDHDGVNKFMAAGERWTDKDAAKQGLEIRAWVLEEMANLPRPPVAWADRIIKLEDQTAETNQRLHDIDKRTVRIESAVERILADN